MEMKAVSTRERYFHRQRITFILFFCHFLLHSFSPPRFSSPRSRVTRSRSSNCIFSAATIARSTSIYVSYYAQTNPEAAAPSREGGLATGMQLSGSATYDILRARKGKSTVPQTSTQPQAHSPPRKLTPCNRNCRTRSRRPPPSRSRSRTPQSTRRG